MAKLFPGTGSLKLAFNGVGNLAIASIVTLGLISGMLISLLLGISLIINSDQPLLGLGIAIAGTLVFNLVFFFVAPFLLDLSQGWLYKTKWISLSELAKLSPKAAEVLQKVCSQQKIKQPRLGLIDDQNPTAFTYGSLRDQSRLVVSAGLFTYLDDEEVATVYAHELGHIVHWDFAVMTLASTLVQIMYLVYVFARRLRSGKSKEAAQTAALVAYVFYWVGTYMLLYLSRTREYFADKFAAETTANPNALARALVKIAYGILTERERSGEVSQLTEGTRALGIYDPKAAAATGNAYRISSNQAQVSRVFLWDLFNPWASLLELNSTHPLTGKRIRALSNYAEQLDQPVDFDLAPIIAMGRGLDSKRLYGDFALDIVCNFAPLIGMIIGLISGKLLLNGAFLAGGLLGIGIGLLVKAWTHFPAYDFAKLNDILSLMADPYASPLRGQPTRLAGELIGRGDAGNQYGSDLKLKDQTGMIYLRYVSRFGSIGNFWFGMRRVKGLIGTQVKTLGWFRRGVAPWVDLVQLKSSSGTVVNSYPRWWAYFIAIACCVVGVGLLLVKL